MITKPRSITVNGHDRVDIYIDEDDYLTIEYWCFRTSISEIYFECTARLTTHRDRISDIITALRSL